MSSAAVVPFVSKFHCFYSKDTKDIQTILETRGYTCTPLTDDPDDFWTRFKQLPVGSTLVICSHGNESGPLLVTGDKGKDMLKKQEKEFADFLLNKQITLYLLSCKTGTWMRDLLADKPTVLWIAPLGYALVNAQCGQGLTLKSLESLTSNTPMDAGWQSSDAFTAAYPFRRGKTDPSLPYGLAK